MEWCASRKCVPGVEATWDTCFPMARPQQGRGIVSTLYRWRSPRKGSRYPTCSSEERRKVLPLLLHGDAASAREILAQFSPAMTKETYLQFQRSLFRTERFAYTKNETAEDEAGRPKFG